MANTIISNNMSLPIPVVGVDPGPQYAIDTNSCLTLIDSHNHSPGSGVQITPSGLNINALLSMNNNILSNSQALNLTPQAADAANVSLYAKGVDLYFIDGNGNPIQITQSGSVAGSSGTITGLPSGTASAFFASSTFTFRSATNTAASIDGRNVILRLSSASSNALTLSPPSALSGGSYQLFLPTIPASTLPMALDSSGNMSTIAYNSLGLNIPTLQKNATTDSTWPIVVANSFASTSALAIVRGATNVGGGVLQGEGFTMAHSSTGVYSLTFTTAFSGVPIVIVTTSPAVPSIGQVDPTTVTSTTATIELISPTSPYTNVDNAFSFIAIGTKA